MRSLTGGGFDSLVGQGGQLFQLFGVGGQVPGCTFTGEVVPPEANVEARRRTTSLFGLGLVDATPDSTFIALAASQSASIRGRVNRVFDISAQQDVVGKFGWKAQVPTLFQFAGDAYLNEMGITNPQFPDENLPQGSTAVLEACDLVLGLEDAGDDVQAFTDFMSFLAPAPPPARAAPGARAGQNMFNRIGCADCHVPTLTSGSHPVAALSNQTYHPFSDFLLHDMGSLGDGIGGQGQAGGREMRIAPLWGLRLADPTVLLHDGRARSVAEAIRAHAGQGLAARDAYDALPPVQQQNVVDYINTL